MSEFDGIFAKEATLPELHHLLVSAIADLKGSFGSFFLVVFYVDFDAQLVLHIFYNRQSLPYAPIQIEKGNDQCNILLGEREELRLTGSYTTS